MKKVFSILFILSFIATLAVLCGDEPTPGFKLLDMPLILSYSLLIVPFAYQLTYMIFLCKKDGVSHRRSVANFFLYLFITWELHWLLRFVELYFNSADYRCCADSWGVSEVWEHMSYAYGNEISFISVAYILCYIIVSIMLSLRKKSKNS